VPHNPDGIEVLRFRPQYSTQLSERSVYFRYFYAFPLERRVVHDRLSRIYFPDYDREMVLLVEDGLAEGREIFAVARIVKQPGTKEAEFAILVADRWKRQDLGRELLRCLVTCEVIAALRDPFDNETVDVQDGGCAEQRRAICIHRKV
jgi:hypothetical protein